MTTNIYHRRVVADANAKACWICYRPSSVVLITPDNDDWFHICANHLTDRGFVTPQDAEDVAKKQREQELEAEIAAIKKEYADKQQKKLEKRKKKDKSSSKDDKAEDDKDEKEKQEKLAELEKKQEQQKTTAYTGSRIFELNKVFFAKRQQMKRDRQLAKENQERLQNPTSSFPQVPSGTLG